MPDFNELDCVRVKRAEAGMDPYTDRDVFIGAGKRGTVVLGAPGDSEYHVEFVLGESEEELRMAVLNIPADNLELVESFADFLEREKSMVSPADAAPGMTAETQNIAVRKDE